MAENEITPAIRQAVLDEISDEIAEGPVNWNIRPWSEDRIVITLRSSVRPGTWLAMHTDRAGWETIKAAGDSQFTISGQLGRRE